MNILKWIFERRVRNSAQNGRIVVQREFGKWQVKVGASIQTSDYTEVMWENALKKVSAIRMAPNIRDILVLGLGGGSCIKPLHKIFPGCHIMAIEHDQEMIKITMELGLYLPFPFPEVIAEDAKEAIARLEKKFNLILLDIFSGIEPSPFFNDTLFLHSLKSLLCQGGALVVNVSGKPEYFETAKKVFPHSVFWKFKANHLGLFTSEKMKHTNYTL